MNSPQPLQLVVLERLHAEAETIDTGRAKTFQRVEIDGLRVRLESNLPVGRDREPRTACLDDRADLIRIEQRRSAAAKKDRVSLKTGRSAFDLLQQRRDVSRLQRFVVESPIEVAVVADRRAEGDVDVEAEHCRLPTADWYLSRGFRPFRRTSRAPSQASSVRARDLCRAPAWCGGRSWPSTSSSDHRQSDWAGRGGNRRRRIRGTHTSRA